METLLHDISFTTVRHYGTWHLSELSAKSTRMIYVCRILIQIGKNVSQFRRDFLNNVSHNVWFKCTDYIPGTTQQRNESEIP